MKMVDSLQGKIRLLSEGENEVPDNISMDFMIQKQNMFGVLSLHKQSRLFDVHISIIQDVNTSYKIFKWDTSAVLKC